MDDIGYLDLDDNDDLIATIFPNPVNDNAVLHLENTSGKVTFSIFESTGKLVSQKENLTDGDFQLYRDNLVQGLYFFRVSDDNGSVVNGKFIVQ